MSDNGIECSWVILHRLVHSHESKQVLNYLYINIRCVTETFETETFEFEQFTIRQ